MCTLLDLLNVGPEAVNGPFRTSRRLPQLRPAEQRGDPGHGEKTRPDEQGRKPGRNGRGTVSAHGAAFWFLLFHAIFVLLPICVLSFWVVSVTYDHRGGDPGLPSWVPAAYLVGALIVVPLIVVGFLAVHADRAVFHLRLLWTGLDCFELAMMIASGVCVWRRSSAVAVTAMCLGSLMFADAWFNIFATTGAAAIAAIVMACGELPLSVYAVYAAHHEVHRWSGV